MIQIEILDEIKDYDDEIHVRMSYDITKSILKIHRRNSYFIKKMIFLNIQEECVYEKLNETEEYIFNELKDLIESEYNDKKELLKIMHLDIDKISENVKKITSTSYKDILRSEKLKRLL